MTWCVCLLSSWSWFSFYRPQRDGRLSKPCRYATVYLRYFSIKCFDWTTEVDTKLRCGLQAVEDFHANISNVAATLLDEFRYNCRLTLQFLMYAYNRLLNCGTENCTCSKFLSVCVHFSKFSFCVCFNSKRSPDANKLMKYLNCSFDLGDIQLLDANNVRWLNLHYVLVMYRYVITE